VILLVEVVVEGLDRPPSGSPLRVEVRDTSLADVEAPLVVEKRAVVAGELSGWLQTVDLEIPDGALEPRSRFSVFVHVDVDADGALSAGDFITTRSYPIPHERAGGEVRLQVAIERI
jgi:hypothetical protein